MKFLMKLTCGLLLVSCSGKEKSGLEQPAAKQYLLTNEISMLNRVPVQGASSYLLELDGKIFLCTAKHLTGPDMGFEPPIDLKTFNDSLDYWMAYPRTDHKTTETIEVEDLYYADNDEDLILLSIKNRPKDIGVLQPQFNKLPKGSRVKVLGCEYSDTKCYQKEYLATLNAYTIIGQIELFMDSNTIELAGFSGAPVLDEENKVIGHVIGGSDFGRNTLKVYLAPVSSVKGASN